MPKRNFGFEKRQKELNKQRKREEKNQRKLDRAALPSDDEPGALPAPEPAEPDEKLITDG